MELIEALAPIAELKEQCVVVTTMGAVTAWPGDDKASHVFHYVPSSMGQGPALGLGLALAAPACRVIVINGDGCMMMNLGCLATIAEQAPANLTLIVLDNGIYEVTGGQPRVGMGKVDFCTIARGCGVNEVFDCADALAWQREAAGRLLVPGPVFIRLGVTPRYGQSSPKPRRPMPDQIADLSKLLGALDASG